MPFEKAKLMKLLRGADEAWFAKHAGHFNYQEHLEHTADYIVKNYDKKVGSRENGQELDRVPGRKLQQSKPRRRRRGKM
ncbi:MAG: hypothetical protein PHG51_06350 [Candidatus Omnitrophica bacterium]|nr:hypothetical protein [Candidatus Omnitrophota bacterium]